MDLFEIAIYQEHRWPEEENKNKKSKKKKKIKK